MPATVTTSTGTKVSTHEIDFHGLSGGMFWTLFVALILYCVGFATTGWVMQGGTQMGLWETCTCGSRPSSQSWMQATQAMITIGLIGLILSVLLCIVYMFIHKVNKNIVIMSLIGISFVSVLFMLIGLIVFGVNSSHQSYSYVFTILAGMLTLASGILGVIQARKSHAF